jgi:hypothetical protein
VWIAVGTNMASARRVEAADDLDLVAPALREFRRARPRTYAYEAVEPFAPNATYVSRPTARWSSATAGRHAPLTEPDGRRDPRLDVEVVPRADRAAAARHGRGLAPRSRRPPGVLDTPVGKLAIVIPRTRGWST